MSALDGPAVRALAGRVSLGILALSQGSIGVWALVGPEGFFFGFPSAGHAWVSVLPPYNEHLTRDVGALSIALTVLLSVAAVRRDRGLSRLAALAFAAYAVPHTAFHALHLEHMATADAVAQMVGFVLQLGLVVLILVGTAAPPSPPLDRHPPRPAGALTPGEPR